MVLFFFFLSTEGHHMRTTKRGSDYKKGVYKNYGTPSDELPLPIFPDGGNIQLQTPIDASTYSSIWNGRNEM